MAIIEVTLAVRTGEVEVTRVTTNGLDQVEKNPQVAKRGDTVNWVFPPGSDNLKVVFTKVEKRSGPEDIGEKGPFPQGLSRIGNVIKGTIGQEEADGRYRYDILDGNQRLKWRPLLIPLAPLVRKRNFGGLDVPKTPPF